MDDNDLVVIVSYDYFKWPWSSTPSNCTALWSSKVTLGSIAKAWTYLYNEKQANERYNIHNMRVMVRPWGHGLHHY